MKHWKKNGTINHNDRTESGIIREISREEIATLHVSTDLCDLKVACTWENVHFAIQDHRPVIFVVSVEKEAQCVDSGSHSLTYM